MEDSLLEKVPQFLTATFIGLTEVQCEDTFSDRPAVVLHSNNEARANLSVCKYSPKSVAFRGEHPPSNGGVVTNTESSIVPDQREDNMDQKSNIVFNDDNSTIACAKLSNAAAIFRTSLHNPQKITALSLDVPTTAKNTPVISSPATKSITTSPNEQLTRTSSKLNIEQQPPVSLKCPEMKAYSFDKDSVEIPLQLKIEAPVIVNREYTDQRTNPQSTLHNSALPYGSLVSFSVQIR